MTFSWSIYLLASSTRGSPGVFTDPDAAYADPFGRLFIGTDGGQPDGLQDQLTVFDLTADEPIPNRLLVGVSSDEVTGWATTHDYRTAFVNLQHPGDGNPANTSFPAPYDGMTIPRDATLILPRSGSSGPQAACVVLEAARIQLASSADKDGFATGRVSVTRVPCPGSLAMLMLPLCASIIRWALASPRPWPVCLVVKNGSKIRFS